MFVDKTTLQSAMAKLYGTAGHLLKIWFTLKHMGFAPGLPAVEIDTSNSTPSLKRLFSYGAADGSFYVPFSHTPRYLTMKHDAARSIIQTNIQRWASSGSVVTCDPTEFIDFASDEGAKIRVSPARRYPFGLGIGESGFALEDGARVRIPTKSFAVWYGRQTAIPEDSPPADFLVREMLRELHISSTEQEVIFVNDDFPISTRSSRLSDSDIFSACQPFINGAEEPQTLDLHEDYAHYARRVRSMVSSLDAPPWMRTAPEDNVRELLAANARAILLYGAPRTGKTRLIDAIVKRDDSTRVTIQIHDGWGYDHLIEGFKPDVDGKWDWKDGPLKEAIEVKKKYVVLEEINRTAISQSLGEVFSLIEEGYRGQDKAITLRSGRKFWIPEDVLIFMTMNTVDKSTEDIDDALLGRVSAVEFPPRPEDLNAMLVANDVPPPIREKVAQLFSEILTVYPLGHGYFAELKGSVQLGAMVRYYKARIRPVLFNYFGQLKRQELAKVDRSGPTRLDRSEGFVRCNPCGL